MSLTSLIRDWFLDPLGMLFLFSLLLMLLLARKRFGLWFLLGSVAWLALMLFVSAPRIVNPMLVHFEQRYNETPACLAERPIVMLGGGVDSRVERIEDVEHMQKATFVRAVAAMELATQYPNTQLFVAGGALRDVTEASVISHFLVGAGINKDRIYEEGDSGNTFENAQNIKVLMNQRELDFDINLVTSALHMQRAEAVFEKQGFTVCPVGVDFQGIHNVPNFALWPQSTALMKFDLLLHEQIAMLVYKFTGRL